MRDLRQDPFEPPQLFRVLSSLTRRIPDVPHASGLSNRIVKPLWCRIHKEMYRVKVWEGIEMIVDPADSLGGNLAFIPQLYDVWERRAIHELLPEGGTFVDVGGNIGAYSLWAARRTGPRGRVVAFEAEPSNYEMMKNNIALNRFSNIQAYQVGVSDRQETLRLQLNSIGNSGGHSFTTGIYDGAAEIEVPCDSLFSLLMKAGVAAVDFMKLDIEGFEQKVLSRFFQDASVSSAMRPRYLLTEMYFGDVRGAGTLWDTITSAGYGLMTKGKTNSLFVRE
jgi:FkbM family methyltransferase